MLSCIYLFFSSLCLWIFRFYYTKQNKSPSSIFTSGLFPFQSCLTRSKTHHQGSRYLVEEARKRRARPLWSFNLCNIEIVNKKGNFVVHAPDRSRCGAKNIFLSSARVRPVPQQNICFKILEAAQLETRQCVSMKIYKSHNPNLPSHTPLGWVSFHMTYTPNQFVSVQTTSWQKPAVLTTKLFFLNNLPQMLFISSPKNSYLIPRVTCITVITSLLHILILNPTFTVTVFLQC